jgi:hypothetical protein
MTKPVEARNRDASNRPKRPSASIAVLIICATVAGFTTTRVQAQTCEPPPTGIVSWFPLDADGTEIVGGFDGISLANGASFAPAGYVAGALDLDGVDDYLRLPDNAYAGLSSGTMAPVHKQPTSGSFEIGDYVDSWILLRLVQPLEEKLTEETFALTTGRPALDSLIADRGVLQIDYAFNKSMRDPRDPESLRRHGIDRTYRVHVLEGADIEALVE